MGKSTGKVLAGVICGLLFGVLFGIYGRALPLAPEGSVTAWVQRANLEDVATVVFGILYGLMVGNIFRSSLKNNDQLFFWSVWGAVFGVIFAAIKIPVVTGVMGGAFGAIFAAMNANDYQNVPFKIIKTPFDSFTRDLSGLVFGAMVGAVGGAFVFALIGPIEGSSWPVLTEMISGMSVFAGAGALLVGAMFGNMARQSRAAR